MNRYLIIHVGGSQTPTPTHQELCVGCYSISQPLLVHRLGADAGGHRAGTGSAGQSGRRARGWWTGLGLLLETCLLSLLSLCCEVPTKAPLSIVPERKTQFKAKRRIRCRDWPEEEGMGLALSGACQVHGLCCSKYTAVLGSTHRVLSIGEQTQGLGVRGASEVPRTPPALVRGNPRGS